MTELEKLAGWLKAATGPDRELGREVLLACGRGFVSPLYSWLDPTASIDAAMSLVPEGCGWIAAWGQTRPDEPMGGAIVKRNARFIGYGANYDAISEAEAATPALALCAAALRARAQMGEG